ncbi:flagellar export chaperone FliS [Gorillibacterium massiliense]|uniref:flagellar export chaperone FliS n=1 Tax=Gorillibacterium massiliense TaxID=1280390 RepID=UPI0004BA20D7|nr:flagellar export chaperone FliS [Gorillibacterium massiliense]
MASPNLTGYQAYQQTKYQTATPHRLTLMLYNGAIQFSRRVQKSIEAGNLIETGRNVRKVQDIIHELLGSLNMREGGELARNLRSLYLYSLEKLREANLDQSMEAISEVIGLLEELKGAWEEIGKVVATDGVNA